MQSQERDLKSRCVPLERESSSRRETRGGDRVKARGTFILSLKINLLSGGHINTSAIPCVCASKPPSLRRMSQPAADGVAEGLQRRRREAAAGKAGLRPTWAGVQAAAETERREKKLLLRAQAAGRAGGRGERGG